MTAFVHFYIGSNVTLFSTDRGAAHEIFVIQRVWEIAQQAETAHFPHGEISSFRMYNTQALLDTMVAAKVVARHMHYLRFVTFMVRCVFVKSTG